MRKSIISLLLIALGILFSQEVFAREFPFTDVKPTDSYYGDVKFLFENGIISDDGSHLFHPNDPVSRDAFVGLSVSVSCKKCLTPTFEDVINYQNSPFVDLTKTNPYFYCIAYANEKNITQGYTLDTSGKASCENGSSYASVPFCTENKTTRIEATAMLLRQANLWNDTLNSTVTKNITIPDVSNYWYGYAQKGIQAKLLTQQTNGNISPDTAVTKGEFAMMAAKMFSYNQCSTKNSGNNLLGAIGITDASGNSVSGSSFRASENVNLIPVTGGDVGMYGYDWTAVESISGKKVTGNGSSFSSTALGVGNWFVKLDILDPNTRAIVSSPTTTISLTNGNTGNGSQNGTGNGTINGVLIPSVSLRASSLTANLGGSIDFISSVTGSGKVSYAWDFGDGTRSSEANGLLSHSFMTPGIYTITVTITDASGKTAQASLVVRVTGEKDSDGDGIVDSKDLCPNVRGTSGNGGCPVVITNNYGEQIRNRLSGNTTNTTSDNNTDTTNTFIGAIGITDASGNSVSGSSFGANENVNLVPVTGGDVGMYGYDWTAVESISGKRVTGSGASFSSTALGVGNWFVELNILDPNTRTVISSPTTTISLTNGNMGNGNSGNGSGHGNLNGTGNNGSGNNSGNGTINGVLVPSVSLQASSLTANLGGSIDFMSSVTGSGKVSYAWDFGDGTRSSEVSGLLSHSFMTPGIYTVTVTITDASGKTAQASLVVRVTGEKDSDGDGVTDNIDLCPNVRGTSGNGGCPGVSLIASLSKNQCLLNQSENNGLIVIKPVCQTCPCENSADMLATIRSCDIIFPTILSPDKKTLYSRGGFYQIP